MSKITAEEILKSKLDQKILILNNPDYTFNKVIEAMQEHTKQNIEALRSKFKQDIICKNCGGQGYTVDVEAGCCNSPDEHGNCCGFPQPIQVQKQCVCYYGHIEITPETIDKTINQFLENIK